MITSEILELALDSPEVGNDLGTPARTSATPHFQVFDYDEIEDREYAWTLVTDSSTGAPVCVTRRFSIPQDFDAIFPPEHSSRQRSRGAIANVRKLDDHRVLLGFGRQQLVLIQRAALSRFFPWVSVA